ncbi:hypothetical protein ANCDUO_11972 [Ancylostoma duodenale]|uniref:G-patch domain-containing protein n=1 Tax=Ancylostoma duodenale TaxID=51022 RepID=A0A0C2D6T8_9BILA|nr:hypothetical protein ANCDUO_11972 [Ancylostoma duodenale]
MGDEEDDYMSDNFLMMTQDVKPEKVLREEALSKPVPETSKGFALMAKMGFKPGMSLGKKKDGKRFANSHVFMLPT